MLAFSLLCSNMSFSSLGPAHTHILQESRELQNKLQYKTI